MSELDDLSELDWVAVPNCSYVMKHFFCGTGYNILVSNLTSLYGEKMTETNIEKRFNCLNPHVKMKPQVILDNLKNSLINCLADQSDHLLKFEESKIVITLNFHAAHVLCKYDFEMSLLPAEEIMHYIIGPTVLSALLSQRKVLELQKKISVESAKPSVSAKTVSSQNVIEPDWLRGKNVPTEVICDSFLTIQSHFKDLYAENYEAYSSKRVKTENTSTVHSISPHKTSRLQENVNNERSVNFVDDDECRPIKKEEETNISASSSQPSRTAAKKKKLLRF